MPHDWHGKHLVALKFVEIDDPENRWFDTSFVGWYGWCSVNPGANAVVITSSEEQCMAVWQGTQFSTLSFPTNEHTLPPTLIADLERFERVVFWFDEDPREREFAERLATKLGPKRCHIVRCQVGEQNGPTSPLDALKRGMDLRSMVESARSLQHTQILSAKELVFEVEDELVNHDAFTGWKSVTLPAFTNITKGLRRGEVSIWTGPTGSGKTTILSMLSLDFCRHHNVRTLWGSFEVKNPRLVAKMLRQYANHPLEGDPELFRKHAAEFSKLPLYFMKFHGSTMVDDVIDAMEFAVYSLDVEHILLDNLQFMMSNFTTLDRFGEMERALTRFREFASKWQVHLTVVVHPRKSPEDEPLGTDSIFGIAKATQEADNVVILQSHGARNVKYLDVKKNRWDGTLGQVHLRFNQDTHVYSELASSGEPKPVVSKPKSVWRSSKPFVYPDAKPQQAGQQQPTAAQQQPAAGKQQQPAAAQPQPASGKQQPAAQQQPAAGKQQPAAPQQPTAGKQQQPAAAQPRAHNNTAQPRAK